MIKRFIALLALGAMTVVVAGCNTVAGAGADVKAAGAGVEKAAEKSKPY